MTERERLIELLDECRNIEGIGMELVEKQADLLLDNGVIVPPVKVGDTLYVINIKRPCYACMLCSDYCHKDCPFDDKNELVIKLATVRGIKYDVRGKVCVEVDKSKTCFSYDYTYWFEGFGVTVFFTKEEAERELERRKNNEQN